MKSVYGFPRLLLKLALIVLKNSRKIPVILSGLLYDPLSLKAFSLVKSRRERNIL